MKNPLFSLLSWSRATVVLAAVPLGVSGLQAANPTDAVFAADRARADAMVKGDLKALDALLADDLRYTHSNGRVETKAAHLGTFADGLRYGYYRTGNLHGHPITADVVVVSGVIDQRKGKPGKMADKKLFFQAVWRKEAGAWRLASLQTAAHTDSEK